MAFRVIDSRRHGRGKTLPGNLAAAMGAISGTYTKDRVLELSGLPGEIFGKLFIHLHVARKTLLLGTTAGSFGAKGCRPTLQSISSIWFSIPIPVLLISLTDTGQISRLEKL